MKVEEIRDDWMKLGWMLAAVDAQPTQPWVEGILAAVPTDVNKRHRAKVQPADTKPAFRKFIREYEY